MTKNIGIYLFLLVALLFGTTVFAASPLSYPRDTIDGKVYYRYKVERSIGLYRISKNFGVTQEEILSANPSIQERGLHYDEVILIPAKDEPQPIVESLSSRTKVVKHAKPIKSVEVEDMTTLDVVDESDTIEDVDTSVVPIRLAIMLPLHLDAIKRERTMEWFYDFYVGSMIAINEVQSSGQAIEVFVYDVGKTNTTIERLLADSTMPKVDAIIGPAYSQQVKTMASYAHKDSTWLLVPFVSQLPEVEDNPYLLKFNPSFQLEADTLARYMAGYGDSINCVLVETKDGAIPSSIMALRSALVAHDVPTTTITIRDILADSLRMALVPDVDNYILFNTTKYGNLYTVMPYLLSVAGEYRISLFSQYSWQNEKIILPQIYTTVFSDELTIPDTYAEVYSSFFGHELSSTRPYYDLLGYDLTRHLLHMLQNDELGADTTLLWNGVQSPIQYHRTGEHGGYENQMIQIIHK